MNESGRSSTGGGAAHRTLKTMIVAEIALAITLVAGAGWLVRSFANLGTADAGFVLERPTRVRRHAAAVAAAAAARDRPRDGCDDRRAPVGVDARSRGPSAARSAASRPSRPRPRCRSASIATACCISACKATSVDPGSSAGARAHRVNERLLRGDGNQGRRRA